MTLMRTWLVTGLVLLGASGWLVWARSGAARASVATGTEGLAAGLPAVEAGRIVAAGRVEPISEALEISAEVSGRIDALLVEADQWRLVNGARAEERREATAAATHADAALAQAVREHQRRVRAADVIPREELDRAASDVALATARQAEAWERARVVDAPARLDEQARAAAAVRQARARVLEADVMLAKTVIRAPLSGTVLRVVRRPGESLSVERPDGGHLLTLADVSVLRVRADVDERDVAQLRVGQRALVSADAYGTRRFTGTVVRVGEMLGRKNIRSEEPTEKVHTKVLETLIELDRGQRLPIGLRVDAYLER